MKDLALLEPVVEQLIFDYDSLDNDTRAFAEELDAEYDQFIEQTLEKLGRLLLKAKAGFKHGEFEAWYRSKGIKKTTAWRAMQVAQGKDLKSSTVELLSEQAIEPPVESDEGNGRVGNSPSLEERRQTVIGFFIDHPELAHLSNREIARRCGVDHKTVAAIRKELFPEPDPPPAIEQPPEPEQPQEQETEDTEEEDAPNSGGDEEELDTPMEAPVKSPALTALQSSESNEWFTPAEYIEAARALMKTIDLDPASCAEANHTVKATQFYTKKDDGLHSPWRVNNKPSHVWLNPPYGLDGGTSNQEQWSHTLIERYKAGIVSEAVLLVNAATEARWFLPLYDYLICLTDHRIRFNNADGESSQPTQGNALVYFGKQRSEFIRLFSRFGTVIERAK